MYHGEAYGISDDGRTIVAFGHGSGWGYRGVVFRLKPDFTVDWWSYLRPISGHYGCVPREISEDGSVAVGISGDPWGGGSYYPAMWRAANNWAPELLANLGVRGDGRYIVGYWLQRCHKDAPKPSCWTRRSAASQNGDVDANGCVDDADLLAVLFNFGNSGNNLGREDTNCDGVVDDADLLLCCSTSAVGAKASGYGRGNCVRTARVGARFPCPVDPPLL
jgi:hypothetical protein